MVFSSFLTILTNFFFSGILRNTIWDKLVFKKIRDGMGGRVKLMITGSAPLSGEVLEFTRIVMGCVVLEGYGLLFTSIFFSKSLLGTNVGHLQI